MTFSVTADRTQAKTTESPYESLIVALMVPLLFYSIRLIKSDFKDCKVGYYKYYNWVV